MVIWLQLFKQSGLFKPQPQSGSGVSNISQMNTNPQPPASLRIAFWLVPAEADRLWLDEIINRLAVEYNAPRFTPHITLLSTKLSQDELPNQIMETAARGFTPISLGASGLDHGPDRFKSVFIRFASDVLAPLSRNLASFCSYPGSYHLDAHLSLLYRQLPPVVRKRIISDLLLPGSPILFDTVVATIPGQDQTSFEDVTRWQQIAMIGLKG